MSAVIPSSVTCTVAPDCLAPSITADPTLTPRIPKIIRASRPNLPNAVLRRSVLGQLYPSEHTPQTEVVDGFQGTPNHKRETKHEQRTL